MGDDRKLPVQARLKTSDLSVGDLARRTGVRPSAIRYYEACGLLPAPARRSGRRRYEPDAIGRMQAILAARRLGFSIADLRKLVGADTHIWRTEARAKAQSLRGQIAMLSADADELEDLSQCECGFGDDCRL